MKRTNAYVGLGVLLVVAGLLMLLQNFGVIPFAWNLLWTLLFAAGGIAFVAVFLSDRTNWWAVIPGFTLLGLAGLIALTTLFPAFPGEWGGALFLGAIGLSFWVIRLLKREFWWAVIPGGTLLTLALVAGLSAKGDGFEMGGLFFLGLAATFLLVYLLPTPEGRMTWALIPAGILGIMGLLLMATMGGLINIIWPLALVLGGAYLVFRALMRRQAQ